MVQFGTLLGHIICKDGVCVDPTKVAEIFHMEPSRKVKQQRETLGHTGYYRRFVRNYASITTPMEMLLKRKEEFTWTSDCQTTLNKLKERLVSAHILVYPDWNKMFHVHINYSRIVLGVVLEQPREKNMDHPVCYASRKLSTEKRKYITTKREALTMVTLYISLGTIYWAHHSNSLQTIPRLNTW